MPLDARSTDKETDIVPRDLHFDLEGVRGNWWLGGDPVATAVLNALSLTFPDGERLFVDAVRHFRDATDGSLREDVRKFIAQEAAHSREHHVLNELIDAAKYPVDRIRAHVRERIGITRARGPHAMLLATIALEHFTAMMADLHMSNRGLFASVDPEITKMWRWHALEETEHKAVAFDVFLAATRHWSPLKRYLVRCWAMAYITWQFTRNIAKHAATLLEADGYPEQEARRAVRRFLWRDPGLFRSGWRLYVAWYRPGFHPWDHDNRAGVAAWRAELDAMRR